MVEAVKLIRSHGDFVASLCDESITPQERHDLAKLVGRKAAGLAVIPKRWTPPLFFVMADAYAKWRACAQHAKAGLLDQIASRVVERSRKWSSDWPTGIVIRSSDTNETLGSRGANLTNEIAADYDQEMVKKAISEIYWHYFENGGDGEMGLAVQARVSSLLVGHISNEQRVSKTINHWMWETEKPAADEGRFNSQRDDAPEQSLKLDVNSRSKRILQSKFRSVGRWATLLGTGRTHLEWVATSKELWLVQLDFEDDEPDTGVDPRAFLRSGDSRASGSLPDHSPFKVANFFQQSGWGKLDKVRPFLRSEDEKYPTLIYITGSDALAARDAGYDLKCDLRTFAKDRAVCRTDCSRQDRKLNLPRTETVAASEAEQFMFDTLGSFAEKGVSADEICFIFHKFIPALGSAWAVSRVGEQIVKVDTLWGLPDGLQFLPHDTFEYDTKRGKVSSERLRYKPKFLQEAGGGDWEIENVSRSKARGRSLQSSNLKDIAIRTHEIAQRRGRDTQIMWFCEIPDAEDIGRDIPWFCMDAKPKASEDGRISPMKKRVMIRTPSDINDAATLDGSKFYLTIDPANPDDFRNNDFLSEVEKVATEAGLDVELYGSTLGHAYYLLDQAGVSVVSSNRGERSRVRKKRVFDKIVRDEIPRQIERGGETVSLAEIAHEEARAALVGKLFEESFELLEAHKPDDVCSELADLLEVIRSLANTTGIEWRDVEKVADAKKSERGAFDKNIVLVSTGWPGLIRPDQDGQPRQITLAELGRIAKQDSNFRVPYAQLLSKLGEAVLELEPGHFVKLSMSGSGIEVSTAPTDELDSGQLPFDFGE